jgi:predicted amino acid-binding ACT domain protein
VAPLEDIRRVLATTTVPDALVDELLASAPALWLSSAPPSVLAADLALCYPAPAAAEVRAVARSIEGGGHRLTVLARDRPGLLADTTAVLATRGLSVNGASAATWARAQLALHSVTIDAAALSPEQWDDVGRGLRSASHDAPTRPKFTPRGRARVECSIPDQERALVTVDAPDQVGLLHAICRWFAENDASIEAASVGGEGRGAHDVFLVTGPVDGAALEEHLSAEPLPAGRSGALVDAFDFAVGVAVTAARRVGRLGS